MYTGGLSSASCLLFFLSHATSCTYRINSRKVWAGVRASGCPPVGSLLAKAANTSAPGDDRISAGIKVFWHWDPKRFVKMVRACIRLGHHPKLWKTAKGVVISKPGKPDYSKDRAYRVISLLDVVSKLVERTAAYLTVDRLEHKRGHTTVSSDAENGGPASMRWRYL